MLPLRWDNQTRDRGSWNLYQLYGGMQYLSDWGKFTYIWWRFPSIELFRPLGQNIAVDPSRKLRLDHKVDASSQQKKHPSSDKQRHHHQLLHLPHQANEGGSGLDDVILYSF